VSRTMKFILGAIRGAVKRIESERGAGIITRPDGILSVNAYDS
jgi:hypothetical protein